LHNSHPHTDSIVASVARHEQELLDKLDASQQEARDLVDQARTDALTLLQNAEAELNNDVAATRRAREAARQQKFDATVQAAQERLTGVREEAAAKVDSLAKDVLAMLMPKTTGGTS
jgi:translation elongation factor EF-4